MVKSSIAELYLNKLSKTLATIESGVTRGYFSSQYPN